LVGHKQKTSCHIKTMVRSKLVSLVPRPFFTTREKLADHVVNECNTWH